jgi:hypothetical protein
MATLKKKIDAERRMRELLDSGGLPEPDLIEYDDNCIRLIFEATETVVVIDLDDEMGSDPDGVQAAGPGEDEPAFREPKGQVGDARQR